MFEANVFFPRKCISKKKRPQRPGFYSKHKKCTGALNKYRWCLICLDLPCNEWDSLMTKDCAILESFQILILIGKQQFHFSSVREVLMTSYKSMWRDMVLAERLLQGQGRNLFPEESFKKCKVGVLKDSFAPCQRKLWDMFSRMEPVVRETGRTWRVSKQPWTGSLSPVLHYFHSCRGLAAVS